MVYAMDTLGYAKRLRDAGIPQAQAEAHAEAAREFVMAKLVTRQDLQAGLQAVKTDLETGLQAVRTDLETGLQAVRIDLQTGVQAVRVELQAVRTESHNAVQLLEAKIDTQTLRLTVRLGGLVAAGVVIVSAIVKLT
jgi:hypothetical protein